MDTRIGAAVLSTALKVSAGDPIGLYVALVNLSVTDLVVNFPHQLQFDFALLDSTGKEYWRYSTAQPPPTPTPPPPANWQTSAASSITLTGSASGNFGVYGIALDYIPLPNPVGDYVTLVGELPSSNMPFTGTLRIETSH